MPRKIYERFIYNSRPNQFTRKVYDRENNVIPHDPLPPAEIAFEIVEATSEEFGTGYAVNDELIIPGGGTEATLKVTDVTEEGGIVEVEIVDAGSYTENLTGVITPVGGTGTGATIEVRMAIKAQ